MQGHYIRLTVTELSQILKNICRGQKWRRAAASDARGVDHVPVAQDIVDAGEHGQRQRDPHHDASQRRQRRPAQQGGRAAEAQAEDAHGHGDHLRDRLVLAQRPRRDDDAPGGGYHAEAADDEFPGDEHHAHPGIHAVLRGEEHHGRGNQQLVRHGVHQLAEIGDEVAAAGDAAVEHVRDGRTHEDEGGGQLGPARLHADEGAHDRYQRDAQERQLIGQVHALQKSQHSLRTASPIRSYSLASVMKTSA